MSAAVIAAFAAYSAAGASSCARNYDRIPLDSTMGIVMFSFICFCAVIFAIMLYRGWRGE